jgi:hypothetical protein
MRLKIIFYFLPHGVILSIFFLNQAKQYLKGLHIQPNSASSLFFLLVSLLLLFYYLGYELPPSLIEGR